MNELEIKKVPFLGTELMAARDADGQIWAGVRWMCDGIGLSKTQSKSQVEKINEDRVLSKGVGNFRLPTSGGMQDAYCLKLDFVPLWLAKISITPTMEAETPELAEKLMEYQLKAKDVLAAAFMPDWQYGGTSKELQAIFMLDHRTVEHEQWSLTTASSVSLRLMSTLWSSMRWEARMHQPTTIRASEGGYIASATGTFRSGSG